MRSNRSSNSTYKNISPRHRRGNTNRGVARSTAASVILTLVLAFLCTPSINAQQKRGASKQERPTSQSSSPELGNTSVLTAANQDYRISPGDVIEIKIEDAPELSHFYRLNSSGQIEMPVIGMVEAQKKTTYELARFIAKGLREQEYLKNPNVLVTITQYYSQTFIIQGSVNKPGIYQTEGRPSVLTMIGLAGGLTDDHGSTIFILRPTKTQKSEQDNQISSLHDQAGVSSLTSKPQKGDSDSASSSDYELIKVNIAALYKGQFEQDQRLEPGDIVNIPRSDVFFVAGEVKAPGSFPLKDGTTLRQAITLAQGMTFSAKSAKGVIYREDPVSGSRQEIKVDISAVMGGKNEDIPVRANDVIIIPNSRAKSVGGMLLMALGLSAARVPIRN